MNLPDYRSRFFPESDLISITDIIDVAGETHKFSNYFWLQICPCLSFLVISAFCGDFPIFREFSR